MMVAEKRKGDEIASCKKGCDAGRVAGCGNRHAVLRRVAWRGGDGAEQSDQIMFRRANEIKGR